MVGIKKVAMIIVMQNDLQAGVDFYKSLGLTLVFHVKERWAEFSLCGFQIGLCPTADKVNLNRTGIVFEVDNLAEFYEQHKNTLNFLDKPTDAAHGVMASIQDPAGNIVDLYQPTPEKIKELAKKMKEEQGCCSEDQTCKKEGDTKDNCCNDDSASTKCC